MIHSHIAFADVTGPVEDWRPQWRKPPSDTMIRKKEIHLWKIELDMDDHLLEQFETFLSADELVRAKQFRFEVDRRYFIARRGARRIILARYIGIEPKRLQFRYSMQGKPSIAFPKEQLPIRFSASSSGSLALLAVTHNRSVGIDVENIGRDIEYEEVACSFFAPSEAERVLSLQGTEQSVGFLLLWTAKEAYLKAAGSGLSSSLDKALVPLRELLRPSLFRIEETTAESDAYTGLRFSPEQDYIATLFVQGF